MTEPTVSARAGGAQAHIMPAWRSGSERRILKQETASVQAIPSPWDRSAALGRVEGDEALLRELVQIFLEESPKHLASLQRAIETANLEEIERTAHSLKGGLGYLGLPDAWLTAKELERMGRERTLQTAADLFVSFQAEVSAAAGAMQDMLRETHEVVDR